MKYKNSRLLKIIDRFKGKEILVVGDLILDKYVKGSVDRLSPEAPVPILKNPSYEYRVGGAANVASNISSLEGKVYLCGIVGLDREGDVLINEIKKNNIDYEGIIKDTKRPTTLKTRFVANHKDQQLLRMDEESNEDISRALEGGLVDYIKGKISDINIVVFSDYGKGLLTKRFIDEIKELAKDKITIVDTKPEREHYFKGCGWFTPNRKEAWEITGISYKDINDNKGLIRLGKNLIRKLKPQNGIILTCGEDGMFLYDLNNSFKHIPTVAKEVSDVSGAGDTVVAAFGLSLAARAKPMDAAILANHAAGIVVGKAGTATVSVDELKASFNYK